MSAQEFQQSQKQTQSLALTPQLRQSLKVLQTPALELRTLIREALEQNPLLEESSELAQEKPEREPEDDWDETPTSAADAEEAQRRRQFFLDSVAAPEGSLREHLLEQVLFIDISKEEKKALVYLIDSLNERGFLSGSLEELAQTGNLSPEAAHTALTQLQAFEPPGIGARDLRECLLLQLKRNDQGDGLAARILRDHFEQLPQRKIVEIARAEKTTPAAVEHAIETIGRLNPAPGRAFSTAAEQTISADLIFYKHEDGQWAVRINEDAVPRLRLSSDYKNMLGRANLNEQDRTYLSEQIRAGRSLLDAIAQRRRTLENVGRAILQHQSAFFEQGPSALKPLTMARVAEEIGVHEATVSRAVSDKYGETPWGFFELKYFFTNGYQSEDGESSAAEAVKRRIALLVREEDPRKPVSDQDIAEKLAQEGISIARRTVAKYREAAGIPSLQLRKRFS